MKKLVYLMLLTAVVLLPAVTRAQEKTAEGENIKTGWNFGGLPVVAYDSDIGFKYGALINAFNYGDGSRYPDYNYAIKAEWSRTTKGSGINQLFFDAKNLLPNNIRLTADFSYLTEQALDFYGFNGYASIFNPRWEDDADNNEAYVSRMFYRHERKLLRFTADFSQPIHSTHWKWLAGMGIYKHTIQPVNIERLNEGKDSADRLPDVAGLYEKYVTWGLISEEEKEGGLTNFIKLGIIYDSRDIEANANQGMWSEAVLVTAPSFLGNGNFGYTRLALSHRQYFTLIPQRLTFAGRVTYQGTLFGKPPFFMQPYMISSFSSATTSDGLGGAKTLRGVLRNRVVGDHIAYANLEFRWKFLRTTLGKQNIYLALAPFIDAGTVLKPIEFDTDLSTIPERENYFTLEDDGIHLSYGAGFYFVMNQNFVVAVNYGMAADEQDGNSGLYINIGFLF
ncbi:MAG: hypothetical protein PHT77_09205 [Bacteroidales bacterium]|nr:hypothetical protein [Bacteroidales bacterium]MDD3962027.1 hypothetical protein [Bacteroidales bacterium]